MWISDVHIIINNLFTPQDELLSQGAKLLKRVNSKIGHRTRMISKIINSA